MNGEEEDEEDDDEEGESRLASALVRNIVVADGEDGDDGGKGEGDAVVDGGEDEAVAVAVGAIVPVDGGCCSCGRVVESVAGDVMVDDGGK